MADQLYQGVPQEAAWGEAQQDEAQQQGAPVAQEGTVTEVPVTQAPPPDTETQQVSGAGVPISDLTAAFNPGLAQFPPSGDRLEPATVSFTNEKALAMALLGRPGITAMTRRLAVALMEEAGGLNPSSNVVPMSPVDLETMGQMPEEITESAGVSEEGV